MSRRERPGTIILTDEDRSHSGPRDAFREFSQPTIGERNDERQRMPTKDILMGCGIGEAGAGDVDGAERHSAVDDAKEKANQRLKK